MQIKPSNSSDAALKDGRTRLNKAGDLLSSISRWLVI